MSEAGQTRAEERPHEATRLASLGRLMPGIAHEINSPTQYLNDYLQFLREAWRDLQPLFEATMKIRDRAAAGPPSADDAAELVEAVRRADLEYLREEVPKAIDQSIEGVDRVTSIVRAMTEFARIDDSHTTQLDVNHLIETVLTIARNELKYVAEVVTELDPELPPVAAFAGEISLAMLNVLINAGQAIARARGDEIQELGRILVHTQRVDGAVEIRITDTGPGIPQDVGSQLSSLSSPAGGDGPIVGGLPIAHDVIVVRHGGALRFDSEMARGTTVIVALPLASAPL